MKKPWKLIFGSGLVLSLVTFFSLSAHANVFGKDDRVSFFPREKPWTAIGRLEVGNGICTGTLISSKHVITAAHCVVDSKTQQIHQPRKIVFKPAYQIGGSQHSSWAVRVTVGSLNSAKELWKDWAILELAHPLGNLYGYIVPLNIIIDPQRPKTPVALVGYSADWMRGETGSFQNQCSVHEVIDIGYSGKHRLYAHDCDMRGGSSGGPILQWHNNQAYIAAINVAESNDPHTGKPYLNGVPYSSKSSNLAAPVASAIRTYLLSLGN